MQVTFSMYLIVCPLVFLASLVDSIGGGGGLISLPAYLLAGLPPALAAGTNKLSACFGSLSATVRFLRDRKVLLMPALFAILGALPGAYAGAEVLNHMPEHTVRIIMTVLIPIVAVVVLLKRDSPGTDRPVDGRMLALCGLSGLALGFYDGFFGPGTGTFLILVFNWICGMEMVSASGTAKPVNFASNIASLFSFILSGHVLYLLALPAIGFSILGGWIGSKLAIRKGAGFIRYIMLAVIALILIRLVGEWFLGWRF